ncbi:MarR family transcriptional regulator [Nonomuraea sp. 10N515B]|uniref:MarR family transcriptional regulator n=1 Tax=Nonomuraea sp. 10N515B TaxID=3457422 RepID=UPI003FCCBF6C
MLPALDQLGPCPQEQLARYLHLTEPATASLIEELVNAGIVSRGQDPTTDAAMPCSSPTSAAPASPQCVKPWTAWSATSTTSSARTALKNFAPFSPSSCRKADRHACHIFRK